MTNICECGCGKPLVRKQGEQIRDFRVRKYFDRECVARGFRVKRVNMNHVGHNTRKDAVFHPAIDKFLYGRLA